MITTANIRYIDNKKQIPKKRLIALLTEIGDLLPVKLSERVIIADYAEKLLTNGEIIIAAFEDEYIGLIGFYDNDRINKKAYVSILGIKSRFQGMGIASKLLRMMQEHALKNQIVQCCLHVRKMNKKAIRFYKSNGYVTIAATADSFLMAKLISFSFRNVTPIIKIPILPLEYGGIELMIKLDGLFAYPYGGNKGRKALYFLNYAFYNNYTHLVTNGAIDSNHARAIAIGCKMLGLQCHIILHYDNDDLSYYDNINYKILHSITNKIRICKKNDLGRYMDDEIELIVRDGGKPLYVWGGGHSPLGTIAYYDAFEETISQLDNSGDDRPDYIFLATGTGTTQAGIIAGNKGGSTKIIGISISRDQERQTNVIRQSLDDFYKYFDIEKQTRDDEIIVLDRYLGNGYGDCNAQVLDTVDNYMKKGLILDPFYTGKAFHGMLEEIKNHKIKKGSKVLFWHTGGFMNYISYQNSLK